MDAFIIAETGEGDLFYRVATSRGVSPIYLLSKQADRVNGNPYLVYVEGIKDWCECDTLEVNVVVSIVKSGTLIPLIDPEKRNKR